jgi:hypothetical protein
MSEGISRAGLQKGELIRQFEDSIEFASIIGGCRAPAIFGDKIVEAALVRWRQHAISQSLKLRNAQTRQHF